jgi:sugar phosphate permease
MNNTPQAAKKPYFYGWTVVIMLFISYSATTVSTNTLPFFFPELMKEFGWKHAQVVRPASFYFIYIAIFAPIVGYLLTKINPKTAILIGASLSLCCTLGFSMMQNYVHLHIVYFVFSMAITLCGLIPSMVLISNWFQKKRGIATGIFLVGSSVGNIIFPQLASRLVVMYDWRMAAVGVAIVAAMLSFIPLIFVKNSPEDVGQNIDGEAALVNSHSSSENSSKPNDTILTIAQLLKSPMFYLLLFVTAAFWFCGFGVLQNLRLYLTDCGFDIRQAANISSLFSVCSIIGKLSFGYLSDKFNKINTLILATIGLILGVLCLKMVITNHNFAYLYAVFYGLGYSGAFAMIQLTVADLYKGASFKKVLGLVSSFDSIGGFAGVALLGYLRTQDGNYNSAMNLLLAVCGGALVLSLVLKRAAKAVSA